MAVSISSCKDRPEGLIPNDVVEYIDATTKEVVHIDLFYNSQYPPGYHSSRLDKEGNFLG